MRRAVMTLCLLSAAVALTGCGSSPATSPGETPLTVEEWKALPAQTKYEVETLERLKLGDPKLQDQRAWDKFTREVLLPAKQKERPDLPAK